MRKLRARSVVWARLASIGLGICVALPAWSAEPSPQPTSSPPVSGLAPLEQRLRAAKTVKVMTSVLGVEVGTKLEAAHAKLDKLSEGGKATKEETEEDEGEPGARKILWQLVGTDYSTLFVKTNDENEVTNITAFLRAGKEIPFDKIGEVKKAPLANPNGIAWDVLRPNRPLFRVVAEGAENKARTLSIFLVKRPNLK